MPDTEGTGLGQIGGELGPYQPPTPAELAAIRRSLREAGPVGGQLLVAALERTAELERALEKYGRHIGMCRGRPEGGPLRFQAHTFPRYSRQLCQHCGEPYGEHGGRSGEDCPPGPCTCGLEALLARSAAAEEGSERG